MNTQHVIDSFGKTHHEQIPISFNVDKGVYHIIKYMKKEYPLFLIPMASCEGDPISEDGSCGSLPYIMMIVRDLNKFDEFVKEIFGNDFFQKHVTIEYDCSDITRIFTIRWKTPETEGFNRRAAELLDDVDLETGNLITPRVPVQTNPLVVLSMGFDDQEIKVPNKDDFTVQEIVSGLSSEQIREKYSSIRMS